MKIRWISATLVFMLFFNIALIGCDNKNDDVLSPGTTTTTTTTAPDVTPDSPEDPVQITTPYKSSDLEKIIMCDIVEGVCVDVSRNTKLVTLLSTVTYTDTKEVRDASATAKYTLSLGEIRLTVYSDYSIGFTGTSIDVNARIVTSDNDFKYLDSIVTGGVLSFSGYNADQSIEIYKATGAKATSLNKADFISKLNQIQYYQTANKTDYNTGGYVYKIVIGGDNIFVYDNMFTVGDNVYLITSGDFDFLKSLSFESSSGELPWL